MAVRLRPPLRLELRVGLLLLLCLRREEVDLRSVGRKRRASSSRCVRGGERGWREKEEEEEKEFIRNLKRSRQFLKRWDQHAGERFLVLSEDQEEEEEEFKRRFIQWFLL